MIEIERLVIDMDLQVIKEETLNTLCALCFE